jgi:hypothetical protein
MSTLLQDFPHFLELVRAWLSICEHYGAIEEGDDVKMKGMGGESFSLGFHGQ